MRNDNRIKTMSFLKSAGWFEGRKIDVSEMHFEMKSNSDMKYIGSKFYMFSSARKFLQSFGGINLNIHSKLVNESYKLRIAPHHTAISVYSLKWMQLYFKRFLYPVAIYEGMPTNILIDETGDFWLEWDGMVYKTNIDFLTLLDYIIANQKIAEAEYFELPDWYDVGLNDEFIENWNYDFDSVHGDWLPKI